MKTASEILKAGGASDEFVARLDQKALNAAAKALDSTFKAPPPEPTELKPTVAIVSYQPKGSDRKSAGTYGQYLSIKSTASPWGKGVFTRLCDGLVLTEEGRNKAHSLLTEFAQRCLELAERI